MTRTPAMFSRTTRTSRSADCCTWVKRPVPRREIRKTSRPMKGRRDNSTSVSTGSRVRVMRMTPRSKMGARKPMRCIMPMT